MSEYRKLINLIESASTDIYTESYSDPNWSMDQHNHVMWSEKIDNEFNAWHPGIIWSYLDKNNDGSRLDAGDVEYILSNARGHEQFPNDENKAALFDKETPILISKYASEIAENWQFIMSQAY